MRKCFSEQVNSQVSQDAHMFVTQWPQNTSLALTTLLHICLCDCSDRPPGIQVRQGVAQTTATVCYSPCKFPTVKCPYKCGRQTRVNHKKVADPKEPYHLQQSQLH